MIWLTLYESSKPFWILLLILNIFMFFLEIAEMVITKTNFIRHFFYTESNWNRIDGVGKISMFIYFSYMIVNYHVPDDEKR